MAEKKFWDILFIAGGIGMVIFVVMTTHMVWTLEGDNCPQTYALFVDVARAVRSGDFSLWNPYLWGGFPNIGNSITQAYYPLNWILCSLFYDPETTLVSYEIIPWNLVFHLSIYYAGMYFLVKRLGFSRLNAFCVGITSTLCCSMFAYRYWIIYLDGLCWLPLIILTAVVMYEEERKLLYSLLLGGLFAMEAMVSVSMMLAIAVYIFGAVFLAYMFGNHKRGIFENLKYSVLSGVTALLLSAPLLLNTLTFMSRMVRYVPDVGYVAWGEKLPIEEYSKYKLDFLNFCQMIDFKENVELGISISAFIVFFCIVGLFCKKKKNARIYYIALGGVILTALAVFAVFFPAAFYYVPGLNQLREAFMYGILLNMSAGIMAAYGFHLVEQVIVEKVSFRKAGRMPVLCAIALLALLGYNLWTRNMVCVLLVLLVCLYLPMLWVRADGKRKVLFCTVTCLFVGVCGKDFYTTMDVFAYTEPEAVRKVDAACENSRMLLDYIESLDAEDRYYRMSDWGADCYPVNMASVLGFYDIKGYLNPVLDSAVRLHMNMPLDKRAQLQNIKYFLVRANGSEQALSAFEAGAGYVKAGEIEGILSDYAGENKGAVIIFEALERIGPAWVVSEFEWNEGKSREEILARVAGGDFSVGITAILEKCSLTETEEQELARRKPGADTGSVVCREISNNRVIYDLDIGTSGVLVTADLYYPGWKVFVNGEKRTLLEVDGTNRGVVVPEGRSVVEFRFSPLEFWLGSILQLAGVVLLAVLGIVMLIGKHRKRHQKKLGKGSIYGEGEEN